MPGWSDRRAAAVSAVVFVAVAAGIPAESAAGGFANTIHSATAAATAGAGSTAEAVDASIVFYNPAAMSKFRRPELGAASGIVFPSIGFRDEGTTDASGGPVSASGGSKESVQYLPSLYGVLPLDERWTAGFGISMPFGQRTIYDASWSGRYHTYESALRTIEFGPSLSYRPVEQISLGATLGIQHARFGRENAVDFGSICFGSLGPAACAGLGLLPQGADGTSDVELTDWSARFTVGALLEPRPGTQLGIVYHSPTRHELEGSAEFTIPAAAAPLTAGGAFTTTTASASITFPESVSAGLAQKLSDRLTLLADLTWTRWERLDSLTLRYDNPAQPALSQTLDWKNSWRASLGAGYQLTESTMLRGGVAYDQSPIRDAFRGPDLPGNDRMILGLGILHRMGSFAAALSYSYAHERDASVRSSLTGAGTLAGEFEQSAHSVGVQIGIVF